MAAMRPSARFMMRFIPASTSWPALSRIPAASWPIMGSAFARNSGRPVARPSAMELSMSTPACVICGRPSMRR